ncbi:hypothetical protein K503DRAFT_769410 [Rhizopogon vinicolor AM-OR11-026]|uniref:Uncharacterized protein n=1 Tax=Rhizopogon vinicolor AM-OR11-026 TaxID=1314800 RepID=A0A1B7N3W7_9AGAM|nr:hypothetical protein K503DRAFT_769410 [Rhizopogon vinicolor AM-OR11-026]
MSSALFTFLLFLYKSLSLITGLFRAFFDLFTGAGRTSESDSPGTSVKIYFTPASSRRPKGLKSLVLPHSVALRRLEDVERRIAETTPSQLVSSYSESAYSTDPELGHCNVVNLWESPPRLHILTGRLQSPTPWASPASSFVLSKHSPESVSCSSWPSVCNTLGHYNKKSLPRDADPSVSPSSVSLQFWTGSPRGNQPLSPVRLNCSYSPSAGGNRSHIVPYSNGALSVASANNTFDVPVYVSPPPANVECSVVGDAADESQEQEISTLATKRSTVICDPAILFTLRPTYSARTPGHGERTFQRFTPSTPSASPVSLVSEWSPSGLFASPVRRTSSSSPCSPPHSKSLSEPCFTSVRDLSSIAETNRIHPDSVPLDPVWSAGLLTKSLVPETVSCPDVSGSIGAAIAESEVNMS